MVGGDRLVAQQVAQCSATGTSSVRRYHVQMSLLILIGQETERIKTLREKNNMVR
jgi:hypothetical protein